jgi:hypothetical protein
MSFFRKLRSKLRSKRGKQNKAASEPEKSPFKKLRRTAREKREQQEKAGSEPEEVPTKASVEPQVKPGNKGEPMPVTSEPTPITSRPNPRPYSVTIQERMRYQRVVLGMSEEEIRRQLPPGQYEVQLREDTPARPSGRGDLAYADAIYAG